MRIQVGDIQLDLTDEQVESLRQQLAVDPPEGDRFLDAAQVAERLGIRRETVYAHAEKLGAIRLGDGPKARLRFDPAKIEGGISSTSDTELVEPTKAKRRRRRQSSRGAELLAVRGPGPYADGKKTAPGGASTPTEGLTKGG